MNAATLAIIIAIVGSSALGTIVAKYFRPNATPLELLAEVRKEREQDRIEISALKSDVRLLSDHVHELRGHISLGLPPPPPPWPEGLKS